MTLPHISENKRSKSEVFFRSDDLRKLIRVRTVIIEVEVSAFERELEGVRQIISEFEQEPPEKDVEFFGKEVLPYFWSDEEKRKYLDRRDELEALLSGI